MNTVYKIFFIKVFVLYFFLQFTETDLIPGMAAFIACLVLPLEIGILTGIAINIIFILYHAARPKISIEFLSVSKNCENPSTFKPFVGHPFLSTSTSYLRVMISLLFEFFLSFFLWFTKIDGRRNKIPNANSRSLFDISIG